MGDHPQVVANAPTSVPSEQTSSFDVGESSWRWFWLRASRPSVGHAISVGVEPGGGGDGGDVEELTNPAAPSSTNLDSSSACSCSSFILISFSSRSFCCRV